MPNDNQGTPSNSSAPASTPVVGTNEMQNQPTTSGANPGQNVENNQGVSTTSTSPANPGQNVQTEIQRNQEAEAGKVSKLEKEVAELRGKAAFLDQVDAVYKEDPEAYEKFRVSLERRTGKKVYTYEELYGVKPQTQNQPTTQPQQPTQQGDSQASNQNAQSYDPTRIKEDLKKELRQETAIEQGFQKYVEVVPDMNPTTLDTPEKKQQAAQTWAKVQKLADVRMVTLGEDPATAMINAHYSLPENMGKKVQQAEENGRMTGAATALANGTGSMAPGGSSNTAPTNSGNTVNMNDSEQKVYQDLIAQGKSDTAERFKQRVAQG